MGNSIWIISLGVSFIVCLVSVPLFRQLAIRTDFLDHPADHKQHAKSTPYLGGAAIFVGILAAVVVGHDTLHSTIIGIAVAILFFTGLYDDKKTLRPFAKLALQGLAAIIVFVVGFHLEAQGVWIHLVSSRAIDLVPTFALFVLMPNCVNLLDNADGLAGGVVGASTLGILIESLLRSQFELAIAAAAVLGALMAFLIFNRSPASIFMGDAGSLPLGLVLIVLAVRAGGVLSTPEGAAITLMYVAIPLADTATVFVARIVNGRSIFQGGQDHLSHRLATSGMSLGVSTWLLIVSQAVISAMGALGANGTVSIWFSITVAAMVLVSVMAMGIRPSVSRILYQTTDTVQPVSAS